MKFNQPDKSLIAKCLLLIVLSFRVFSLLSGNPSVMSAVVNQEVEDSNNSNNNNNDDTGVPELLVQTDMGKKIYIQHQEYPEILINLIEM